MTKYVSVSATDNPDYLFYLPIISWAWNKLGWKVFCFYFGESDKIFQLVHNITIAIDHNQVYFKDPAMYPYRKETMAQCSRMYAADLLPTEDFIMTSDVDMLPLSDYWQPNEHKLTAYGRDLSDRHYVMCYCAMKGNLWHSVFGLRGLFTNDIIRDLDRVPDAKSEVWSEWFQVDQEILTDRLNNATVTRIDRGISHLTGYPIGRVDRSAWERSLQQKERIDAHLFREGYKEENFCRVMQLIKECFNVSDVEIAWMEAYRKEYVNLM